MYFGWMSVFTGSRPLRYIGRMIFSLLINVWLFPSEKIAGSHGSRAGAVRLRRNKHCA
jgi:hypothetical protein